MITLESPLTLQKQGLKIPDFCGNTLMLTVSEKWIKEAKTNEQLGLENRKKRSITSGKNDIGKLSSNDNNIVKNESLNSIANGKMAIAENGFQWNGAHVLSAPPVTDSLYANKQKDEIGFIFCSLNGKRHLSEFKRILKPRNTCFE